MEMEQGTVVIRLQRSKQRSVEMLAIPSLVGTLLSASVVKRLDDDDESSTTTTAEET
jgi:hypothetical protein